MEIVSDQGRWVAVLKPTGVGRYFGAAFMMAWLTGWVVGELLALAGLLAALASLFSPDLLERLGAPKAFQGGPLSAPAVLFLAVWLSLWTAGGVMAIRELLRSLWSRDRLEFDNGGIDVTNRLGPFVSRRRIAREQIRGVRLSRSRDALVADLGATQRTLTRLGRPDERLSLRDHLRQTLALTPAPAVELPRSWEAELGPDGAWLLMSSRKDRRTAALIMWGVALAVGLLATLGLWSMRDAGGGLPVIGRVAWIGLAALAAAGAAWLSHGHRLMRVRPGQLEFETAFGARAWRQAVRPIRLRITRLVDSDGDEHFELRAEGPDLRRQITSSMYEPETPIEVGRWLAARLGVPLELDPGVARDL